MAYVMSVNPSMHINLCIILISNSKRPISGMSGYFSIGLCHKIGVTGDKLKSLQIIFYNNLYCLESYVIFVGIKRIGLSEEEVFVLLSSNN